MKKGIHILLIISLFAACNNTEEDADAYGNFESTELFVSAKSPGEIILFEVEKGQIADKNEVVGIIDTTQYSIQKKQIEAKKQSVFSSVREIDAQISTIESKIENLELNRSRIKALLNENAATRQQYDNINSEIEIAQKQINQAKAKKQSIFSELKVLNTQIDLINNNIDNCFIRNPVKGTVIEKFTEQNEFCVIGKPLYKVSDLSVMELKCYLGARQIPEINIGQKVKVSIDGHEDLIYYDGEISWISDEAEFTPKIIQTPEDRINLVYAAKVKVINDGKIKSGMPGELHINSQ